MEKRGSPALLAGPTLLLGSLGLGKGRDLSEVSQGDGGGAESRPRLCASCSPFSPADSGSEEEGIVLRPTERETGALPFPTSSRLSRG